MREIILVSETFSLESGWGTVAASLANEAVRAGWKVIRVAADNSGDLNTPLTYKLSDGLLRRFLAARKWSQWVKEQPADIIHLVTEPQFWLATWTDKPCIGTIHGTYAAVKAHGPFWARYQFSRGTDQLKKIVAVSQFTGQVVENKWKGKLAIIPNGLDQAIANEPKKEIEWQTKSKHKILLVGAIKRRKGCLELVKGFAEYIKDEPDAVLAMVGQIQEGTYLEEIKSTILFLGLDNKIKLAGLVDRKELLGWYNWCDVMALLPVNNASFEGFGLVYLEANAFGRPVLGIKNTAAEEAISPQTGRLAASIDPQDVAAGLKSLFNENQTWDFKPWLMEHSWENIFKQYQAVYLSLVGERNDKI